MATKYEELTAAHKQFRIAAVKHANRVAKTKASIIGTLLGDIETKMKRGENIGDSDVVRLIKIYIKDINTSLACRNDNELSLQKEALVVFLPKQLSETQLKVILSSIITDINAESKDFGKVMAALKTKYDGQYDGKQASEILKSRF